MVAFGGGCVAFGGALVTAAPDFFDPTGWVCMVGGMAILFVAAFLPEKVDEPLPIPKVWSRLFPPEAPIYQTWVQNKSKDTVVIHLRAENKRAELPRYVGCEVSGGLSIEHSGPMDTEGAADLWVEYPFDHSSIGYGRYFYSWRDGDGNMLKSGSFVSPKGYPPSLSEARGY